MYQMGKAYLVQITFNYAAATGQSAQLSVLVWVGLRVCDGGGMA